MSFATVEGYEKRVHESFAKQGVMQTFGAQITTVEPGEVNIEMPFDRRFTQQHGFLHAGVVTTVLDSAAGYAAYSLMPAGTGVLTIELKTSLMRVAEGALFRFEGRVLKAGRNVMFAEAKAYASNKEIAHLTASMMVVEGREGIEG
ncbi:PaaI family thioesterase [Lentibacter algarum]|uniref:PaaI family thioesterase n=1 Tax=Lentibacter algarum TaxID=576131 RepID=UPI001C083B65|nr:PaaI family thioesterase [Lentibacter algarum]MBU2982657.1 PaaI family thioesterase [Lentibacter algarum]